MPVKRLIVPIALSLFCSSALAQQPIYFTLLGGGETHDTDYLFALPLPIDLEDEGDTIGGGVGYQINDNWNLQLEYTYTDADDVDIEQIMLSVNYQWALPIDGLSLVLGALFTEGSLEWNNQPDFTDFFNSDLDDDETGYGVQAGFRYRLSTHWSTSLMYQYLDQEFNTHLDTDFGRLDIEHSEPQYLLFSLHYNL
jgi:hypothetical protein